MPNVVSSLHPAACQRPRFSVGECLMVRADARAAFERLGWRNVAAIMQSTVVDVARRVASRDNCSIELALESRSAPTRCFLKRHRESHPLRWAMATLCGQSWTPAGKAEADAVTRCHAQGVPAMETVAAGWRPGRQPWQCDSFFLSEQVAGQPADDAWQAAGRQDESNRSHWRRNVLACLAATARQFHAADLYHRDFYWCHFFVEWTQAGAAARLIDLQRVLSRPRLSWRWRLKDLAQFVFSMPADLTVEERRTWFAAYLDVGVDRWSTMHRFCWLAVRVRAKFYGLREWLRLRARV